MCIWAFTLPLYAQSLEVTQVFEAVPYSVVSAQYKNEFGKWEKPLLDDTFPYALIRIGLEGNAREVSAAKQKLGLYMGRMYMPLDKVTDKPNELLFLVPAGAGHIEIQCGDGCKNQVIIDLHRLRSNTIYYGKVHFVPEEEATEFLEREKIRQEILAELANKEQIQPTDNDPTSIGGAQEEISPTTLSKYQVYAQNAKIKTLIMGQMGYSVAPQLSYGAMIGQIYRGYGWYVSGRSNFQFGGKSVASCDADGLVDGEMPFYSGKMRSTHFAIQGGFMMNFLEKKVENKFNTLGFYVGGGYGKRELSAETTDGHWIQYAPTSHSGFSGNLGLYGSVYGVTLNVGLNTINFKYLEVEFGIGFMF